MTDIEYRHEDWEHQRPTRGVMAKVLGWALPPNPQALFVWPDMAYNAVKTRGSRWRYVPLVAVFISVTIGLIALLLQVPGLNSSVVGLLTSGLDHFFPHGFAIAAAWVLGMAVVISLGSFVRHTQQQRAFDEVGATRDPVFNFWLRFALWEEMAFRAGAEKWTWAQRIRASVVFGLLHITNIWYSFAAGIALAVTGMLFMFVYLWVYKRTHKQILATSVSAVVHAIYNYCMMIVLIIVLVAILVVS